MASMDAQLPISKETTRRARIGRMRRLDGFIYNAMAMGVVFPWLFLSAPALSPGGNLQWAILIAFTLQLPIALTYCLLAQRYPVDGGDYIFQTRSFGVVGYVVVIGAFVLWFIEWLAFAGWLASKLAVGPLLVTLAIAFEWPRLAVWGVAVQQNQMVMVISAAVILSAAWLVSRGLRIFALVQRGLSVLTVLAIIGTVVLFLSASPDSARQALSDFVLKFNDLLSKAVVEDMAGVIGPMGSVSPDKRLNVIALLEFDVRDHGFFLRAPYTFASTLAMVPMAWLGLQWCTYSVQQNGQIEDSKNLRTQVIMILGALITVTACLLVLEHAERHALGAPFIAALAAATKGAASARAYWFVDSVFVPFPTTLAMGLSGTPGLAPVAVLIAAGVLANAFQVACNCFIGSTRILSAARADNALPVTILDSADARVQRLVGLIRRIGLTGPISDDENHRMIWVYATIALVWLWLRTLISDWSTYAVGINIACSGVFAISCLAAATGPSKRHRVDAMGPTDGSWRVLGAVGFVAAAVAVLGGLYVVAWSADFLLEIAGVAIIAMMIVAYFTYAAARLDQAVRLRVPEEGQDILSRESVAGDEL